MHPLPIYARLLDYEPDADPCDECGHRTHTDELLRVVYDGESSDRHVCPACVKAKVAEHCVYCEFCDRWCESFRDSGGSIACTECFQASIEDTWRLEDLEAAWRRER